MADFIKCIINKRVFLIIFGFCIHCVVGHSTSDSSRTNYEEKPFNCTRIQFQCINKQFTERQTFQCNNGICIPAEYKCDGVKHCCDGSDEWPHTCRKNTGKSRKKRATDGHCAMPSPSPDKTISYECSDYTTSKSCTVNGLIRENTLATIACNPNYKPINGTLFESVCSRKKWRAPIDKCYKICEKLTPINVNLECYRENTRVPCDENSLIAGVRVHPTCKLQYTYQGFVPQYDDLVCQENGSWNDILFSCKAECGIQYKGGKLLIANGREEHFGDSPWHVAVYDHKKFLICGGTIIHPFLILSAAHCFHEEKTDKKLKSEDFEIVVGKITRNYDTIDNQYQKAFKIREIRTSNTGYFASANFHAADIAILILKEEITLSPNVLPACIDPIHMKRYPPENTIGKVSGWGSNEKGELTQFLHTADLPFISRKRCIEMVPDDFKAFVTLDKFCAGSEEGAGVLQGDSGGGLLFQQGNFYYIRGIVSIKRPTETKIAAFTDLASHVDWILEVRDQIELEIKGRHFSSLPTNYVPVTTTSTMPRSIIPSDHCAIATSYTDKTPKYECQNEEKNCVKNNGTAVSEYTKATFTCNPGYQQAENETLKWACLEGSWVPELPICEKICNKLTPINVDLACFRNNIAIDCKGPLIAGDRVFPTCKPLHSFKNFIPAYQGLLCQEDGTWDNVLFACTAECGRTFNGTDADILTWNSKGKPFTEKYNKFPWHVAIYNTQTKEFICSGTIIHTNLILSAAHCFYSQSTRRKLDAANFEILVSKVTPNYAVIENRNQRSYKINEIRYPNSSYSFDTYSANDIALLIVKEKIIVKKSVLPACVDWIHFEYNPIVNYPGEVGAEGLSGQYIGNKECKRISPGVSYDKFCSQFQQDKQQILPNSGSGWFSREGNFYYIRGIVSMKQPESGILPFTNIANHITWIREVFNEMDRLNSI